MKQKIEALKAPAEISAYSNAIKAGNLIFISGQLPVNPETGEIPKTIAEQTEQVIINIRNILADAGASLGDVVKTTVMLSEICLFSQMNEVYVRYFSEPYPARTSMSVKELPQSALVCLDVVAIVDSEQ